MLAAVSVVPASATDFPDGAQRFNWCNCQDSVQAARGGMGAAFVAPPLIDFNHWSAVLTGGGAPVGTPAPSDASPDVVSRALATLGNVSPWLVGAVAVAAVYFVMKGKK